MIVYTIYKPHTKYPLSFENPRDVYEHLCNLVGHDVAQDAEGWCELASVGEIYQHDRFAIEVEEL